MKRVHNESKSLEIRCSRCPSIFAAESQLKQHTKRACRETQEPMKCEKCNKTYTNRITLVMHNKRMHLGTTYPCTLCERKFNEKGNLRRHMVQIHTDLKAYQCPKCQKMFGDSGNMKRHIRHVHDKARCPCPKCGKLYHDKGQLS